MATHKGDVIHYFSWILRKVELAAEIRVRIDGLETFTWVTFGPDNVAPLMGAHALEGVRLAVDPLRRILVPTRILRMSRSSHRLS